MNTVRSPTHVGRRLLVVLVTVALVPLLMGPSAIADEAPSITQHTLARPSNVTIEFTVFKPAGASASEPVPMVFHSHGWGGSMTTTPSGAVGQVLGAGYGVLSFSARGHGGSGGHATVHHQDHEVGDTSALIDWVHDNLDWVQRETDAGLDKDIVLGGIGGSYGGGFQTTSATHDARWDALVPQMTWNDLRYSLAPSGVVKSVWVDGLYAVGVASIDLDPRIHDWYREAMLTNEFPAEAKAHFVGSNPDPNAIGAPTLLIQGQPDVLFNWNEAVANYEAIEDAGVEVALVGYNGGHILPGVQPVGFMGPGRSGEPCGAYGDLALAWFEKHLRGDLSVDVPTGVSYATEQGACVSTAGPEDNVRLERSTGPLVLPSGAGSLLVPLGVPAGTLAGIPTVSGELIGTPGDHIHFFGLVVRDGATGRTHVVDDQTTPLRYGSLVGVTPFELDLVGVATELDADDELFLRIDAQNEWFATNGARHPGASLALDLKVSLPFVQ